MLLLLLLFCIAGTCLFSFGKLVGCALADAPDRGLLVKPKADVEGKPLTKSWNLCRLDHLL
jgi:hypothetical protein